MSTLLQTKLLSEGVKLLQLSFKKSVAVYHKQNLHLKLDTPQNLPHWLNLLTGRERVK